VDKKKKKNDDNKCPIKVSKCIKHNTCLLNRLEVLLLVLCDFICCCLIDQREKLCINLLL